MDEKYPQNGPRIDKSLTQKWEYGETGIKNDQNIDQSLI